MAVQEMLWLDGIGVRLGGRQILRDVSFTVQPRMYRPLLLSSALPQVADARGVGTRRMKLCFLVGPVFLCRTVAR